MLAHQFPAPQRPSRVLILGAHGFLAAALAQRLEQEQVSCRRVSSQEVDLIDASSAGKLASLIQPADAIVVTAALTPDKGRDVATLMKNLKMAEHLGAALATSPCAHLLYISSDAVYDSRSPLIDEQSSCEPADLYALMHIARERMLASACQPAKIPYLVVRPCAVYGAADTHNSYGPNRFVRTALADGAIRLFGQGEERRDHVYVRDVVEILTLCLLHASTGVINAVSGEVTPFHDVARLVADSTGREVRIESLPRSGPVTHRHFDNTALIRAFPSFRPTPLAAGIAETVSARTRMVS